MQIIYSIQNRIYEIKGERVMLDFDLAALYGVATKVLNQAVKRNSKRFPPDFMFRLSLSEWEFLRSQIVPSSEESGNMWSQIVITSEGFNDGNRSQIVTSSKKHRGKAYLPYAFTEQGVAMLSGVLNSDKAISMNIAIMRAFVEIRRVLLQQNDVKEQLRQIKEQLGEHDAQLDQIYDAMENLLDEKAAQRKWEERERIGFVK